MFAGQLVSSSLRKQRVENNSSAMSCACSSSSGASHHVSHPDVNNNDFTKRPLGSKYTDSEYDNELESSSTTKGHLPSLWSTLTCRKSGIDQCYSPAESPMKKKYHKLSDTLECNTGNHQANRCINHGEYNSSVKIPLRLLASGNKGVTPGLSSLQGLYGTFDSCRSGPNNGDSPRTPHRSHKSTPPPPCRGIQPNVPDCFDAAPHRPDTPIPPPPSSKSFQRNVRTSLIPEELKPYNTASPSQNAGASVKGKSSFQMYPNNHGLAVISGEVEATGTPIKTFTSLKSSSGITSVFKKYYSAAYNAGMRGWMSAQRKLSVTEDYEELENVIEQTHDTEADSETVSSQNQKLSRRPYRPQKHFKSEDPQEHHTLLSQTLKRQGNYNPEAAAIQQPLRNTYEALSNDEAEQSLKQEPLLQTSSETLKPDGRNEPNEYNNFLKKESFPHTSAVRFTTSEVKSSVQPIFPVGKTVLMTIPQDYQEDSADQQTGSHVWKRHIWGVVLAALPGDVYRVGTRHGRINRYVEASELTPCDTQRLHVGDVPPCYISVREAQAESF